MKTTWFLIILLFPFQCYSADKWTKEDIVLETTFQIIHFIDWRQTHYIGDNDEFEETNISMRKKPKDHDINNTFALIGLSHAFVTHNLSKNHRKLWHYSMILYKCFVVNHNKSVGVHFSF